MPAAASTDAPGGWTTTSTIPPIVTGWQSLACPTATHCLGVAYAGTGVSVLEQSVDGGRSFTSTGFAGAASMNKVACATARFCVLAGSTGGPKLPAGSYVTHDGGAVWVPVALPPASRLTAFDVSLGCSSSVCYLAPRGSPTPLLSLHATGGAWSPVALPSSPDAAGGIAAIGCGAGRCVAVGTDTSGSQGLLFESDGGAWTETVAPAGTSTTTASVFSVACSAYACAAFGTDFGSINGLLLASTADGTWDATPVSSQTVLANSISCVPSGCLAVGGNWSTGGLDAWSLSGVTPTWASVPTPT
ncbi:MAG TPA: hypothetical protein VKT18_09900, partial [Acidimicrobiales bacterium]|nr:hypothetical protein [Acidimicrobiales bacterium]